MLRDAQARRERCRPVQPLSVSDRSARATSRAWHRTWLKGTCHGPREEVSARSRRMVTIARIGHPSREEAVSMEAAPRFDRLREHSIGLPQVLFQSITHMAPGAAVAYSIYISVPF